MAAIKFTSETNSRHASDGKTWTAIDETGAAIGWIESHMTDDGSSYCSQTWRVDFYEVTLRTREASEIFAKSATMTARQALTAAKNWIRETK
jgi:hypothetical protein